MQRGYKRSITGLYRFLRKQGILAVKPPNPKYVPKPYEKMDYPGQRIQIDVKFVPAVCLVNAAKGQKFYQYTAIDEYSRWRFVEAFEEHSSYSSAQFLEHLIKAFPYPIKCVQTDNGQEFTKQFGAGGGSDKPIQKLFVLTHLNQILFWNCKNQNVHVPLNIVQQALSLPWHIQKLKTSMDLRNPADGVIFLVHFSDLNKALTIDFLILMPLQLLAYSVLPHLNPVPKTTHSALTLDFYLHKQQYIRELFVMQMHIHPSP